MPSSTSETSRTTGSGFPIASTMSARASKIFIVVTIIIIIVVIIIIITTPPRPLTWGRMPVGESGGVQLTLREVGTIIFFTTRANKITSIKQKQKQNQTISSAPVSEINILMKN